MNRLFKEQVKLIPFRPLLASLAILSLLSPAMALAESATDLSAVEKVTGRVQTKASGLSFSSAMLEGKGDYKKALENYKQLLEIFKNDPGLGPDSARYAWALSKTAICQNKLQNKPEAQKLCKEALALIDGLTPDNSPIDGNYLILTRQNCLIVLDKEMPPKSPARNPKQKLKSIVACDIDNLQEEENQLKQIIATEAKKKGKLSAEQMNNWLYLANIYTLEKKYTEAEPLFKKAMAAQEKQYGKTGEKLLPALSNYGFMLKQAGKEKEAQLILKRMQLIAKEN